MMEPGMEPEGRDYYDAHKKSVCLTYLLWIVGFGANNFYAGNITQGVFQLILTLLWVLVALSFGEGLTDGALFSAESRPIFIPLMIWRVVDLLKIPGYIRKHNLRVLRRIGLRDLPYDW